MEIQNIAIPAILIAIAVIWLVAMPARAKGKTWHYALVGIPTFAFIMMRVLPAGVLRESLAAWLTGGAAAALLMLVAWAQGSIKRNHGFMDIAYPLAPTAIAWAAFLVPTGAATGEISGGGMAPLVLALVSVCGLQTCTIVLPASPGSVSFDDINLLYRQSCAMLSGPKSP